jgi:hypothetical protein
MPEIRNAPCPSQRTPRSIKHLLLLAALTVSGALAAADCALAAGPAVPAGFTITRIAGAPAGATNCDDLARLDGHIFITCQNATLSTGGGGNSTIAEYTDEGTLLNTWSLTDKADGMGADPFHHRLIVTLNEDARSHLVTIAPSEPAGQQITNYNYSPGAPGSTATTGALHTGGGTDSVSVDSRGYIYITASHAAVRTGTAVYRVVLTPPATPGGTGTATLNATYLDNATAANANGGGTVKLSLGDVDSGAIVPQTSPLYAGDFVIDDQTALLLVFARNIDAGTGLTALKTPFGLDDIRWSTADNGTMYVVDKGAPVTAGVSYIYKVTGPFVPGVAYASSDGLPEQVDKVNLATGALTPFITGLTLAKGLLYVDPAGADVPASVGPASASTATITSAAAVSSTTSDSDTLPIVLAIVSLALLLVLGGYLLSRSPRTP